MKYILKGETPVPCPDLLTWARWIETSPERLVRRTVLGNGLVLVSTIFLGLDHWGMFFETMVFSDDDHACVRYATYREAVEGHELVVHEWSKRTAAALILAVEATEANRA